MATYGTALIMRGIEKEVFKDATEFSDVTLEYYAETYADPIINGRMEAAGYTTPFTSPYPEMVILLSSMIGVSVLMESALVKHTARNVERARTLLDDATKIMDMVQASKMSLTGVSRSTSGAAVYVDPDPEERPAASVFTGPPEQWQELTETRET